MAFIHCTWQNKSLVMRFKGKMTVDNAQKIRKGLLQLNGKQAPAYYADLSQISDIDITFFQLLTAFNLKIKNNNSQLYILKNTAGNKLLDDLEILGIDINTHFLIAEGNNDITGKQ